MPAAAPVAGSLLYTAGSSPYGALGSRVIVVPYQIYCGAFFQPGDNYIPVNAPTLGLQSVQFDIAATATGALGTGTSTGAVVHQGVQAVAPGGSCP